MSIASLNDLTRSLETDFWRLELQNDQFKKDLEKNAEKAKLKHHRETGGRTSEHALFPSSTLRETLKSYRLGQRYKNKNVERVLQKYNGKHIEPLDCSEVKLYSQFYDSVSKGVATTLESVRSELKAKAGSQSRLQNGNFSSGEEDDDEEDDNKNYSPSKGSLANYSPSHKSSIGSDAKTRNRDMNSKDNVTVDLLRRLNLFPTHPNPVKQSTKTLQKKVQADPIRSSAPVHYAYRIPKGSFQTFEEERTLNAEALGVLRKGTQTSSQTSQSSGSLIDHLRSMSSHKQQHSEESKGKDSDSDQSNSDMCHLSMYSPSPSPTLYALAPVYPRVQMPRQPLSYSETNR